MKELLTEEEIKGLKVVFGLEAQGHIPVIESELQRWNDSFTKMFPNEKDVDMTFSTHVWERIGKKIGWDPFSAALHYFEYLKKVKKNATLDQQDVVCCFFVGVLNEPHTKCRQCGREEWQHK